MDFMYMSYIKGIYLGKHFDKKKIFLLCSIYKNAHILTIVRKKQNTARAKRPDYKSKLQNTLGASSNFLELNKLQKNHPFKTLSMLNILKFKKIDTLLEYKKHNN